MINYIKKHDCQRMLVLIVLSYQFIFIQTFSHQQPIAEKVWSVRCKANEHVLNDCNWCWCGQDHHFKCKARLCEQVDIFGHFKDTIQELDVGMEGHGSWRSRPIACTPGVQYKRGNLLCICDEDGNWPNPVCRDILRILHPVEVTENVEEATSQTCTPTKLYLVACNACFCPTSGKLDATLCTNRTCLDGDPVLEPKEVDVREIITQLTSVDRDRNDPLDKDTTDIVDAASNDLSHVESIAKKEDKPLEIYAPCNNKKTYTIGRQDCECIANNRLVCKDFHDNTSQELTKGIGKNVKNSLCKGRIGSVIRIKCNFCKCTSSSLMYCTAKKCLSKRQDLTRALKRIPKFGKPVTAPVDDIECVPGTTYTRGCNLCSCRLYKGKKIFDCWIRPCLKPKLYDMVRDCVSGTTYEKDCLICSCDNRDGKKFQTCMISPKCSNSLMLTESHSEGLDSLHGYCEPLHVYRRRCNSCRCLSNGKLLRCTTNVCNERSSEPVQVEVVPFHQAQSEPCPKGHTYRVACNLCYCLVNGNALCTTANCST